MATTGYCSDSPLAIASGIVGILTLALTFILSCITYFFFTLGALDEIKSLAKDGQSIDDQVRPVLEYCMARLSNEEDGFSRANGDHEKRAGTYELENLEISARELVQGLVELDRELNKFHKFIEAQKVWIDWQARRRLIWAYQRTHSIERMKRLSRQQAQISAEPLTLILK